MKSEFTTLISGNCTYCGQEPQARSLVGKVIYFNGIDRVDNAVGYLATNCVSCCAYCNWAKNDRSRSEFEAWIRRASAHLEVQNVQPST